MNLAKIISNQSRAVIVLVVLLCAAGIYAAFVLPSSIFPQTDFPRIVIIVDNGDTPAEQMLVSVTRPVEEAMNGIPGISNIRSTTARGSADINLFFDWNVDVVQSLQLVQARVSQLNLPPTAQIRRVDRLTFAVFPVSGYSLTSDKRDLTALRDIASYTILPRLARLAGVANVAVAGGDVREYHITVDPQKLHAHNVSLQQVADAVKNSNQLASPGLIEENHQLELTLISGQATKPDELNQIVVATVNNVPVKVFEVATVAEGVQPNYTIVTADGKRAVLVNILRQPNANTVAVTDEVKDGTRINPKAASRRCQNRAVLRPVNSGARFDELGARRDFNWSSVVGFYSLRFSAEHRHDARGDYRNSGHGFGDVSGDVSGRTLV